MRRRSTPQQHPLMPVMSKAGYWWAMRTGLALLHRLVLGAGVLELGLSCCLIPCWYVAFSSLILTPPYVVCSIPIYTYLVSKLHIKGILFSFPFQQEPSPPPSKTKIGAPPPQDSTGPLMRLSEYSPAPTLFICGEMDYNCPGAELKKVADKLTNMDTRAVILQDLDSKFNTGGASHPTPEAMNQIFNAMDTFLSAIQSGSLLSSCDLPRLVDIVPSTRVPPRPAHLNEQPGYEDEGGDDDEEDEEERSQEGEQGKQKHQGGANAGNGDVPASWQQQLQQVLSANPQLQAQAQSQLQMTILQQQMAMAAAAVGNRQPQVHITLAEGPQIVTRKPNDGQKKP